MNLLVKCPEATAKTPMRSIGWVSIPFCYAVDAMCLSPLHLCPTPSQRTVPSVPERTSYQVYTYTDLYVQDRLNAHHRFPLTQCEESMIIADYVASQRLQVSRQGLLVVVLGVTVHCRQLHAAVDFHGLVHDRSPFIDSTVRPPDDKRRYR